VGVMTSLLGVTGCNITSLGSGVSVDVGEDLHSVELISEFVEHYLSLK